MKVEKRDGTFQNVSFDKIQSRLQSLCLIEPILENVDTSIVSQKVCSGIYDGIRTLDLDILSSETSISLSSKDPEYGSLSAIIVVSNHHKNTSEDFYEKTKKMYDYGILQSYYWEL